MSSLHCNLCTLEYSKRQAKRDGETVEVSLIPKDAKEMAGWTEVRYLLPDGTKAHSSTYLMVVPDHCTCHED